MAEVTEAQHIFGRRIEKIKSISAVQTPIPSSFDQFFADFVVRQEPQPLYV